MNGIVPASSAAPRLCSGVSFHLQEAQARSTAGEGGGFRDGSAGGGFDVASDTWGLRPGPPQTGSRLGGSGRAGGAAGPASAWRRPRPGRETEEPVMKRKLQTLPSAFHALISKPSRLTWDLPHARPCSSPSAAPSWESGAVVMSTQEVKWAGVRAGLTR